MAVTGGRSDTCACVHSRRARVASCAARSRRAVTRCTSCCKCTRRCGRRAATPSCAPGTSTYARRCCCCRQGLLDPGLILHVPVGFHAVGQCRWAHGGRAQSVHARPSAVQWQRRWHRASLGSAGTDRSAAAARGGLFGCYDAAEALVAVMDVPVVLMRLMVLTVLMAARVSRGRSVCG